MSTSGKSNLAVVSIQLGVNAVFHAAAGNDDDDDDEDSAAEAPPCSKPAPTDKDVKEGSQLGSGGS